MTGDYQVRGMTLVVKFLFREEGEEEGFKYKSMSHDRTERLEQCLEACNNHLFENYSKFKLSFILVFFYKIVTKVHMTIKI